MLWIPFNTVCCTVWKGSRVAEAIAATVRALQARVMVTAATFANSNDGPELAMANSNAGTFVTDDDTQVWLEERRVYADATPYSKQAASDFVDPTKAAYTQLREV